MRSAPIRYGTRIEGCRFGIPHDPVKLHEDKRRIVEKCRRCGIRKIWLKGHKDRIDNIGYLRFHVRSLAQPNGSTKRVYNKIHNPEKLVINLCQ